MPLQLAILPRLSISLATNTTAFTTEITLSNRDDDSNVTFVGAVSTSSSTSSLTTAEGIIRGVIVLQLAVLLLLSFFYTFVFCPRR